MIESHLNIIKLLAYRQEYFNRQDIKTMASKVDVKMQNTKSFVNQALEEGLIMDTSGFTNGPSFIVTPSVWLQAMREITGPKVKRILSSMESSVRPNRFSLLFAESLASFLNGGKNYACDEDFKIWESHLYKKNAIIDFYTDYLSTLDEMYPFLKQMPEYITNSVLEGFIHKLKDLLFDEKDYEHAMALRPDDLSESHYLNYDLYACYIPLYYHFMNNGDLKAALECVKDDPYMEPFFQGISLLQANDADNAYKAFKNSLKQTSHKLYLDPIMNFYYGAALRLCKSEMAKKTLNAFMNGKEGYLYESHAAIKAFRESLSENKYNINNISIISSSYNKLDRMLASLVCRHYNIGGDSRNTDHIYQDIIKTAANFGHKMIAIELSNVFPALQPQADQYMSETGLHPTLPTYKYRAEWEDMLDSLIKLNETNGAGTNATGTVAKERIVYEVRLNSLAVQPKLQKSRNGVTWSSGRNIALSKFYKCEPECMTEQDKMVANCVETSYGWYIDELVLFGPKCIAALIGHPYVYDSQTGTQLEIIKDKAELNVAMKNGVFNIKTNIVPTEVADGYYIDTTLSPTIKVIEVSKELIKTIETLSRTPVPEAGKGKLTQLLGAMSNRVIVMSDLLQDNENIESVDAHSEILLQLKPDGQMIRCMLGVRPFGSVPPICKVGKGMQVVTTTIDKRPVRTSRNLALEKQNGKKVRELLDGCDQADSREDTWMLTPSECLELLNGVREMADACIVEWPEGERFKVVAAPLSFGSLNVSVGSIDSWFEMSGEVKVNADKKMKIAELLSLLADSTGNYIKLDGDEYVKVTSDLRKYLDAFSRISKTSKGKIRFSPFNALQIEDMEKAGMKITTDESFRSLMTRIHESADEHIKIPKAIQADLRSYQKDGYEWMSRLAHWGAGALLADDMGLGKTVQTITLLLSRAKQGPQLVILPTSLIINWRDEIARFAPSLNTILLNRAGIDRTAAVKDAGAFDIVISTYGLLITEEENLTSRQWTTIVLDEAHTIKNKETKMSKTAMSLQADFRLLLTGTPLQNHVSEMWNLMQFANPDLLGSFNDFSQRFLLPIERDHNKDVQKQLKRIISPFILRRTKSDVLNELPEKTEITLKVDLSDEELAFYDSIREQALANLASGESTAVKALAEIMRLRQAACNSLLVNKDVNLPSSKMECFMQLVSNLHDNHHRALVFSQFTSHLALVRQRLDAEGVQYLYLDGATPAKERLRLVEEFQHGDMPLFLISLKAGGLGLNLTAADYVIHLDPWWNPAIEEQASDRAYRIGQQNPVTVYRLIARGTIEEKILCLHQTKRNMADALLEGSDMSAAMSREEMLALIKEQIGS